MSNPSPNGPNNAKRPNGRTNACTRSFSRCATRTTPWEDGLPKDLEREWVALAPIPKGKRCIAVSFAPSLSGPDEHCILDDDVTQTGVLHILDVIRWRGTDVAQCEADFRFWFRDARLAELAPQPEPTRTIAGARPYPHRFLGVPYYLPPLTPTVFLQTIIPIAQVAQSEANFDGYGNGYRGRIGRRNQI
ncbi:hypothetical protein RhiXN_08459 [Rhizoctonia solani]|uniref:Snurportin-1 n=1 Tax=Rhizoctonia solani TaxID=456999 RepID=A0A8H8P417_9AGAM|nr:uncharacterized protein RhiXN_08459 [Rhizoctonia solani]QRW23423.1 hypothetical protein RhiXN_08459 [Rhizoctonia solani]